MSVDPLKSERVSDLLCRVISESAEATLLFNSDSINKEELRERIGEIINKYEKLFNNILER